MLAVILGGMIVPRLFRLIDRLKVRGAVVTLAIGLTLALAAAADLAGSALIIGAFAAGLVDERQRPASYRRSMRARPVARLLAPIFFVTVGAGANIRLLDPRVPGAVPILSLAVALTLIAVVGKIVSGWAAPGTRFGDSPLASGWFPAAK